MQKPRLQNGEGGERSICVTLSYFTLQGVPTKRSKYGPVPDTYSMDGVYCNGTEIRLLDCKYITSASDSYDCTGSSEGAGVDCSL